MKITEESELSKRLSWDENALPFDLSRETISNVDIWFYGYLEDIGQGIVELKPIRALRTNVRLSNRNDIADSSELLEGGMDVGIIRITETGAVNLETDVYR